MLLSIVRNPNEEINAIVRVVIRRIKLFQVFSKLKLSNDFAIAVEVADSSLAFDRRQKGSLYARAGIPDYWIVNLVHRVVEIYRDPHPDPSAVYGWSYRSVTTVAPPAFVVPLAFPDSPIAASDLLP